LSKMELLKENIGILLKLLVLFYCLLNTIPYSYISGFSLFKKLYGCPSDYSFFRVFCCTCFIVYPHVERSKLCFWFAICVFFYHGKGKKGYHYFDPITHKLYVSRHVVFFIFCIYLSFLFYPLLIAWLDLILFI
jgi:hypothetical protein